MTLEPQKPEIGPSKKDEIFNVATLEDLFYLGYATSDKITVYKDGDKEITAVFRTLTPIESREVWEEVVRFSSLPGQALVEKVETLIRAVKTINDMPLVLDPKQSKEFRDKHGENPSPLDQARIIFWDKISSELIINALYEKYFEFSSKIKNNFDNIKKKLNSQTPSA